MKRGIIFFLFVLAILFPFTFSKPVGAQNILYATLQGVDNEKVWAEMMSWYNDYFIPLEAATQSEYGGLLPPSLLAEYSEEHPGSVDWGCMGNPNEPCSNAGSGPLLDFWNPVDSDSSPPDGGG